MKEIQYLIELFFLKILIFVINIFPWKYNRKIAKILYPLLYFIGNYKKITKDNIKKSNIKVKNIDNFIKKVFIQNILTYIEMIHLIKMNKKEVLDKINFKNEDVLKNIYKKHGNCLFVLSHIGNWEILGQAVAYKGYNLAAVARRQNNPYTNKIINNMREKSGLKIIYREGNVAFKILKKLKKGYGIGLLNDQDGGISGVTTRFMGRNCSTPQGPAVLGLKTETPVCYCYTLRNKEGKIDAYFENPFILKRKSNSLKKDIQRGLQRIVNYQEKIIQQNSEQWNWLANRWRTERKNEKV